MEEIQRLVDEFDFEPMPHLFGYERVERDGVEWHVLIFNVPNQEEILIFEDDDDVPMPPSSIAVCCTRSSDEDPRVHATVWEVFNAADMIRR